MFEWIPWFVKQCFICKQRDKNVIKFKCSNFDSEKVDYCHKECLNNLVKNPSNDVHINSVATSILERLSYDAAYLERSKRALQNYNPDFKPETEGEKENVETS
jgi:hypothetical protein